jgi:hypothetical protein
MLRFDLEVRLEQLDERQGGGGLTVGDGLGRQNEPAVKSVRMRELVEETRLPDTRFPHDRNDLSVALSRSLERQVKLLELRSPPDEAGQAASGRSLQAGSNWPGPGELVRLEGRREALDGQRTKRSCLDVALGEPQRVRRDHDCPRQGCLLHPRGQMSGLANRRVVHAEVASDGASHDLA